MIRVWSASQKGMRTADPLGPIRHLLEDLSVIEIKLMSDWSVQVRRRGGRLETVPNILMDPFKATLYLLIATDERNDDERDKDRGGA